MPPRARTGMFHTPESLVKRRGLVSPFAPRYREHQRSAYGADATPLRFAAALFQRRYAARRQRIRQRHASRNRQAIFQPHASDAQRRHTRRPTEYVMVMSRRQPASQKRRHGASDPSPAPVGSSSSSGSLLLLLLFLLVVVVVEGGRPRCRRAHGGGCRGR